jgi:hypothetical protein
MNETKTTVAELIEKLKEFDGDIRVVLWHHWGGCDDLNLSAINITKINISRDNSENGGKYISSQFNHDEIMEDAVKIS